MKSGLFTLLFVVLFILANFIRNCFAYDKEDYFGKEALAILEKATIPFDDSYLYSIWGQCQYEFSRLQKAPNKTIYDETILNIKSDLFESGYMPLRLAKLKDKKRAPLMVYFPGAFSGLTDTTSDQWITEMTKNGFNVVVVPNPWSSDYIKQNPHFYFGDFIQEGFAHYELFTKVVSALKEISNGEIHLSGVSYGAFLAAITTALDAQTANPLLNTPVNLISPPYHFKRTLARFDKLLFDFRHTFKNYYPPSLIAHALPVCVQTRDQAVPEYIVKAAPGVTAYMGFHQYLVESVILQDRLKNLNRVPDRDEGILSENFNNWKNHLSFKLFIHQNIPIVIDYFDSEVATLSYWTDLLLKKELKFRILTSNDDFINDENVWDSSLPYVFRLDHGGHFGFRHEKWFYSFMQYL